MEIRPTNLINIYKGYCPQNITFAGKAENAQDMFVKNNNIDNNNSFAISKKDFAKLVSKYRKNDYLNGDCFKINLHIHSNRSDGALTVAQILNQAVKIAERLPENEKFVFSITDHDTIEGCKIAQKIINSNPEKYKKITLISGVEISGIYENMNYLKTPQTMDILLYGFDIDDKTINDFLNSRRKKVNDATEEMCRKIDSSVEPFLFYTIKLQSSYLNQVNSNAYLHQLRHFLSSEQSAEDNLFRLPHSDKLPLSNEQIDELFLDYFGDTNCAFAKNSEFLSLVNLANKTNSTLVIAHPGRIDFENVLKDTNKEDEFIKYFLNELLENNVGIELNYAKYIDIFDTIRGREIYDKKTKEMTKKENANFIATGGQDSHDYSIGTLST